MKSEFFWGLFSSLIVALAMILIQNLPFPKYMNGIEEFDHWMGFSFSLLPFIGIYFIVGVIMLFSKKSEQFAKGLLLSALILLVLMLTPALI